jgi:hypothetical protein
VRYWSNMAATGSPNVRDGPVTPAPTLLRATAGAAHAARRDERRRPLPDQVGRPARPLARGKGEPCARRCCAAQRPVGPIGPEVYWPSFRGASGDDAQVRDATAMSRSVPV